MTDEKKENEKTGRGKRTHAVIEFPGKPKGSKEPEQIFVGVHGDRLNINFTARRQELIPVHISVIHALQNALEPVSEDGTDDPHNLQQRRRKTVRFTPRFPFTLHCWITKKQYDELRKIATKRSIKPEELNELMEAV